MTLAKPISSPMSASSTLSKFEGSTIIDPTLYRSTVGSLQYLSRTCPDLAFVMNKVSQFMQDPHEPHWIVVKRILRYLKFTSDHNLCIHRHPSHEIVAFSDSNWVGCPNDKCLTSGYCIFLSKNMLSWSSKKQPTTESKYKAVANATTELM